ncbi:MAG: hypothetical protein KGI54_15225 [Pseudomonadota bacterium]|nr:hypothetical protein [Pseudomonadota bacterium]
MNADELMTEKKLNYYRGLLAAGKLDANQISELFDYIYALEDLLDEADHEDFYGTEGWRYALGVD